MKRLLVFLLVSICSICLIIQFVHAEEIVFPAGELFVDPVIEKAHVLANKAIHARYLFQESLYTCTAIISQEDDTLLFEYRWQYSPTIIFSAIVPKNLETIKTTFNAELNFGDYYDELIDYFGCLFGDWTLEQKAWLSSIIDEHWDFEVFRTYYLDSRNTPHMTVFFDRLLNEERCGLPGNDVISQEEAYSLAIEYSQKDSEMSQCEPWQKIQVFYLVNDPQNPKWVFRFVKTTALRYDVVVDAHIKEITALKK